MVAATEGGTGAGGENKLIGLRLGWVGGAATVSAARTTSENTLTTLGKLTDCGIGGSYDFGVVKLAASWLVARTGMFRTGAIDGRGAGSAPLRNQPSVLALACPV